MGHLVDIIFTIGYDKDNMGIIYKITNTINDKVYIGQTVKGIKSRWAGHKVDAKRQKGNHPMYNAMNKYGADKFTIEVVTWANSQDELNYQEWLMVHKMNSLWPNGYNMMEGGGSKGRASEATKKKQSEYWTEYYKNNVREGQQVINIKTGELFISCTAAAKSIEMVGGCLSAKLLGKIGNNTDFRYVGMEDVYKKPVPYEDRDWDSQAVVNIKTGETWKSAKELMDLGIITDVTYSAFKSKLNGTIGNNTDFVYLDPENDKSKEWAGRGHGLTGKEVINIETKETWSSGQKCAKDNDLNYGSLRSRLNGRICNDTPFRYVGQEHLSFARKRTKKRQVVDIDTKETWEGLTEYIAAHPEKNLNRGTVNCQLIGKNPNRTGLRYVGMEHVCKEWVGGVKRVINDDTDKVWESGKECARDLDIKYGIFKSIMSGKKNRTDLTKGLRYVGEEKRAKYGRK